MNDITEIYSTTAKLKEIQIDVCCNDTITVCADPNALNLILRNLVDNATKHVQLGGKIDVYTEETPENVVVTLTDNGSGMNADKLAIVRTALVSPEAIKPEQDSMGFGLVIVGTFAKLNNIKIQVESTPKIGTTFYLSIPKG